MKPILILLFLLIAGAGLSAGLIRQLPAWTSGNNNVYLDDGVNVDITGQINATGYLTNGTVGFTGDCPVGSSFNISGGIVTGCGLG